MVPARINHSGRIKPPKELDMEFRRTTYNQKYGFGNEFKRYLEIKLKH